MSQEHPDPAETECLRLAEDRNNPGHGPARSQLLTPQEIAHKYRSHRSKCAASFEAVDLWRSMSAQDRNAPATASPPEHSTTSWSGEAGLVQLSSAANLSDPFLHLTSFLACVRSRPSQQPLSGLQNRRIHFCIRHVRVGHLLLYPAVPHELPLDVRTGYERHRR